MKLYFENIEELSRGIAEVADELGIELVDRAEAEYVVTVENKGHGKKGGCGYD